MSVPSHSSLNAKLMSIHAHSFFFVCAHGHENTLWRPYLKCYGHKLTEQQSLQGGSRGTSHWWISWLDTSNVGMIFGISICFQLLCDMFFKVSTSRNRAILIRLLLYRWVQVSFYFLFQQWSLKWKRSYAGGLLPIVSTVSYQEWLPCQCDT